jgi:hypothetical protein
VDERNGVVPLYIPVDADKVAQRRLGSADRTSAGVCLYLLAVTSRCGAASPHELFPFHAGSQKPRVVVDPISFKESYGPAVDAIRTNGTFLADGTPIRTISLLKDLLVRLFPVEGLLFDGDDLVGEVRGVKLSTPPARTQMHGGVGGPRVQLPARPGLRTLEFSVSAHLDPTRKYQMIDHMGNSFDIENGNFNTTSGKTFVVSMVP